MCVLLNWCKTALTRFCRFCTLLCCRLRNVLSALLTVIVAVGLWASNSSLSSLSTNFAETEQSRSLALDTQRLYEDLLSAETGAFSVLRLYFMRFLCCFICFICATGQRGYLLTSNATYLQVCLLFAVSLIFIACLSVFVQPYKEAVTDIPIALAVVAANSDAQGMALLPAIKANVQMKVRILFPGCFSVRFALLSLVECVVLCC